MSKTITIEGAIYLDTGEYADTLGEYRFFGLRSDSKLEPWRTYTPVMRHTITSTVPDDFDPRQQQIEALEEQRREIYARSQAAVTEINARISKLQAITFEPAQ